MVELKLNNQEKLLNNETLLSMCIFKANKIISD